MHIVSKWHSANKTRQITPIAAIVDSTKDHNQARQDAARTPIKPSLPAHGYSVIAAQVIAARFEDEVFFGENADVLSAANAYQETLDRKVHRMASGSFYEDAA